MWPHRQYGGAWSLNGKMISRAVATARVALGGKVKGYTVRRGRGLGVRLKTTSLQTKQMLRNPNERPGGSSGRNEGTKLNVEIVLWGGGGLRAAERQLGIETPEN